MSALAAETLPRVFPTVVHMLADTCARFPDATALVCGRRNLSYAEYLRCVAGFAAGIGRQHGARGSRVALVCANSLDMPIAMFAAHAAGAQAVPINPAYTERELSYILEDADPAAIVYDTDIAEQNRAAGRGAGHTLPGADRRRDGRTLDRWRHQADRQLPQPWPAARRACDLAIHRRHDRPAEGRQHQPPADGRQHQPAGSRIADACRR